MLVLSGHGWGHGVGMSQWGAYGYALHGWSAAQILQHYYPGTALGRDAPLDVRVLVSGPDVRVRLGSSAPWRLVDGAGTAVAFPAGTAVVPATLLVGGRKLVSPLTLRSSQPLTVGGHAYRGTLLVVSNGSRLDVVNMLGMETYLDGVVGAEMPASWPAAALQAQAIAARSYALSQLEDIVTAGPFDLFGDTRSQAYGGIAAESPAAIEAVAATAHEVVLYQGQVARTYYSASSGGETASAAEVFGTPSPYLVPVSDPYDTLSPYHDWGPVEIPASLAGEALGLSGPLESLRASSGPSRHVTSATAIAAGGQVTLSGTQVAADLGLRSSWFTVGWLDLDPPTAPVPIGTTVTLSGRASGLDGVELEDRAAGSGWQLLESILPTRSGSFSVSLTPAETTSYRLVAGGADGSVVKVSVAAVVSASLGTQGISGTVSPAAAGERVELQRAAGDGWTTVTTATTGSSGSFSFALAPDAATYRVRVAPGSGLVAGVSSAIQVPD